MHTHHAHIEHIIRAHTSSIKLYFLSWQVCHFLADQLYDLCKSSLLYDKLNYCGYPHCSCYITFFRVLTPIVYVSSLVIDVCNILVKKYFKVLIICWPILLNVVQVLR